jgi:hypothetical protein
MGWREPQPSAFTNRLGNWEEVRSRPLQGDQQAHRCGLAIVPGSVDVCLSRHPYYVRAMGNSNILFICPLGVN